MNKNFWQNKSVLITGFEGFLGSNLTHTLVSSGARIVGLDIKVKRKQTILAANDYKKIKVVKGSVADYKLVKRILTDNKVDIIFHLAAEAIVGQSFNMPRKTFEANVMGTWEVLEAARQYGGVKAIIVASSDKAYGSHKKLPYTEEMPLIGRNIYDVSKSCADLIAYSYFHSYGLPVAITRCGNIYGPGDFNFSRIIPDAVRCALAGKELLMRSDGKFTRDYIFVDDIAQAYILLAEKLQKLKLSGEAFNFSDADPRSVLGVVREVAKISGKKMRYKILGIAKYEIKHQYLNAQKAKAVLGWSAKHTFAQGIEKTITWLKAYLNKA